MPQNRMLRRCDEVNRFLPLRADDVFGIIDMTVQCKDKVSLVLLQHIKHMLRSAFRDNEPDCGVAFPKP